MMQEPIPSSTSYFSPKRKRDAHDALITGEPPLSRLRTTTLPTRPLLPEQERPASEGSPRMSVAGHLEGLDLDPKNRIPHSDVSKPTEPQKSRMPMILDSSDFNPHISLPSQTFNAPVTPPPSSDGPLPLNTQAVKQLQSTSLPLEIPETPRLRPVNSPTPPPSATKPILPESPPTPSESQTLWWDDDEITGHDPKDPSDDGYGINGIGFLPTAAIANSRVEKRKKQVAEWKNREARDARQKRNDRRRRREVDARASGNPVVLDEHCSTLDEGRKVRFLGV